MKGFLAAGIVIVLACLLPGCATSSGNGTAYGYVEAVGEELGTPTAYIKSSLEASKSDFYCADRAVVPDLQRFAESGERVAITYSSAICFGLNGDPAQGGQNLEGRITAVRAAKVST